MSDTPHRLATRLAALFQRLAEHQVDAYLVPSSDAHLNEYVPIYQRRRAAITVLPGQRAMPCCALRAAICLWIRATICRRIRK